VTFHVEPRVDRLSFSGHRAFRVARIRTQRAFGRRVVGAAMFECRRGTSMGGANSRDERPALVARATSGPHASRTLVHRFTPLSTEPVDSLAASQPPEECAMSDRSPFSPSCAGNEALSPDPRELSLLLVTARNSRHSPRGRRDEGDRMGEVDEGPVSGCTLAAQRHLGPESGT